MASCAHTCSHSHPHVHNASCGHVAIKHDDHVGFLHDGHLHCLHDGHVDDHSLTHEDPLCGKGHACSHPADHHHGDGCGHPQVPHNGHTDFLVDGHLHHHHGNHCDHHGTVSLSCAIHASHPHAHGAGCGHPALLHHGHVGYLHHGHLHCPHEGHVDEHVISISKENPAACDEGLATKEACSGHVHGPSCGHPAVPHGDHVDFLFNGQLHHPHGNHCDHHGTVIERFPLHPNHEGHVHGQNCGHVGIKHDGHVDYLHDGHLHHVTQEGCEEHVVSISAAHPATCTPHHAECKGHVPTHVHGGGCGHEQVVHGDHFDYLVDGHLHHPHGNHCDHHGALVLV